jgi:hypothetical protein
MMRYIRIAVIAVIALAVAWFFWTNFTDTKDLVSQYVDNSDINTFEASFTPEKIMKDLLKDKNYSFKPATVRFYPYLLLDVKYTAADKSTKESQLLWGLNEGEIVLNTDTWEKTHGFQDCLNADASRYEFRILNSIAKRKGPVAIEDLQKELHLDADTLEPWIDSARQKHLIVQRGSQLQLHFENPKIAIAPESKITKWIVTKPSAQAIKIPRRFSKSQIEKISKAAFGSEFTIRESKEIYLPVYNLEVQNPDGSTFATNWNAITGE